jgi:hypothetical protein
MVEGALMFVQDIGHRYKLDGGEQSIQHNPAVLIYEDVLSVSIADAPKAFR